MTERIGQCQFFGRTEGGFQCATVRALPIVRPAVMAILGESVSMADVQGLVCHAGGTDCPVLPDLVARGLRSIFARPV